MEISGAEIAAKAKLKLFPSIRPAQITLALEMPFGALNVLSKISSCCSGALNGVL